VLSFSNWYGKRNCSLILFCFHLLISVIRRIFGYQRSESVKAVLHGLGKLFKTGLLHDVLWFYVLSDCISM